MHPLDPFIWTILISWPIFFSKKLNSTNAIFKPLWVENYKTHSERFNFVTVIWLIVFCFSLGFFYPLLLAGTLKVYLKFFAYACVISILSYYLLNYIGYSDFAHRILLSLRIYTLSFLLVYSCNILFDNSNGYIEEEAIKSIKCKKGLFSNSISEYFVLVNSPLVSVDTIRISVKSNECNQITKNHKIVYKYKNGALGIPYLLGYKFIPK
jgi:hypothetical protein